MDTILILLVVGVILRTVLDLLSLNKSSYIFDSLYSLFFCIAAVVLLSKNTGDWFGYLSLVLAGVWGLIGFNRYKNKTKQSSES